MLYLKKTKLFILCLCILSVMGIFSPPLVIADPVIPQVYRFLSRYGSFNTKTHSHLDQKSKIRTPVITQSTPCISIAHQPMISIQPAAHSLFKKYYTLFTYPFRALYYKYINYMNKNKKSVAFEIPSDPIQMNAHVQAHQKMIAKRFSTKGKLRLRGSSGERLPNHLIRMMQSEAQ